MSDFGRSGDAPTAGDLWRYLWLGGLALLVLLAVLGQVDGGLVILLAVLLLVAAGAGVLVLRRRHRA